MGSMSWIRARNLGLLILLLTVVGCGSGLAKAKVKGRVKFFDKYLNTGTVAFMSKDGQIGAANIDADGNYEMSDAPVGDVTITVTITGQGGQMSGEKSMPKAPVGVPAMRPPGGDGGTSGPPLIDPKKMVQIPPKYSKPDTSGLTYTVQKGEQTHNITLSP